MKKSVSIFASAVVAAMMCVFTGCSDEDYVKFPGKPNKDVVEKLATTKTPIAFKATGETDALKHVKGDKWEFDNDEIDPSILPYVYLVKVGFGPDVVIFEDGKTRCSLWTNYGYSWVNFNSVSNLLRMIWRQYIADTHAQQIYVEADFDSDNNLLKFNDEPYGIFACEYNKMTLSDLGENNRSLAYYELTSLPEDEDCHIFNNCMDGFQFIIDCAREKYGDVFVYGDSEYKIEYDLNEIEQRLKEQWY